MSGWAIFAHPKHAIEALHYCTDPEMLLPAEIMVEPGKGIALPLGLVSHLRSTAEQQGWPCEFLEDELPPYFTPRPIAAVLASVFHYLDPLRVNHDGASREYVVYDPFNPATEYVLAATSQSRAQSLLDILRTYAVGGIRAVPLSLAGGAPFTHFWLLAANHPPDLALQAADRVWWGPAGSGRRSAVFVQWPLSVDVPDRLLQRVPWGKPRSLVLLSRDVPQVLTVQPDGQAAPIVELIEVGNLDVRGVQLLATQTAPNSTRFEVALRLAPLATARGIPERIRALQREVAILETELARLQSDLEYEIAVDPEPLHIYYSSDESEIPDELQRLLVEWTGQPGDLECVQYQKLDASSFPDGLDRPWSTAHVVTTSFAIGRPQRDRTLGKRLAPYSPLLGARNRFTQLPRWQEQGLNIFVPHGRSLELDPRLVPSPATARKLGVALLASHAPADWAVLLVPHRQSGLSSFLIPTVPFRSIAETIDWRCSVNVEPASENLSLAIARDSGEALLRGITQSLDRAVRESALERLSRQKDLLRNQLNKELTALQARRELASRVASQVRASTTLEHSRQLLSELSGSLDQVSAALESAQDNLETIAAAGTRIIGAQNAWRTEANEVNRLRTAIDSLRKEIGRAEGWR